MGIYREYVDRVKGDIAPQKAELRELKKQFEALSSSRGVFRIVVAGSFSCGKSAFINHILKSYVAVPGANRTTRCSTEYFFSEKKCWLAGDKSISEAEYRDRSTRDNSTECFRVGLPSDFLKSGVSVVDTPGFENDKNDRDNATREINDCDILFWLENINKGTIQATNLDALVAATAVEGGQKPLAVFLTQTDTLTSDRGSKTAAEKREIVRKNIADLLLKNKLRLIFPPLAVSNKDEQDIKPSLRALVKGQDESIAHIVEQCKNEAAKSFQRKAGALEKRHLKLQREIEQKCQECMEYLTGRKEILERSLTKASNEQERYFRKELADLVRKHLDYIAGTVFSNNPAIVSWKCAEGWLVVADDYTSEFHPSEAFLEAQTLYRKIGKLLAKHSDYDGRPCQCEKAVYAVLNELKISVHSVTCDSFWGDNETSSRCKVAQELRDALNFILQHDMIEACFLNFFEMPKVKWRSANIDRMRSDIKEINDSLKRIRDMLGNCVPIPKPAKKPTGDSSQAKDEARQGILGVLKAYRHMLNGGKNEQ